MKRIFVLAALLTLVAFPARAVDFTQILYDDDGCPIRNDFTTVRSSTTVAKPECPRAAADTPLWRPDITLGDIVFYTLSVTINSEQPQPDGPEKYKRRELGLRLRTAKDMTLTPEEIVMIKKVVGILWPPSLVGTIYPLVDPTLVKK